MTYSDTLRAKGLLTIAPAGTKCMGNTPYSGSSFDCAGNEGAPNDAVHTWEGRHYCAYHSPFDLTDEERAAIEARKVDETTNEVVLCGRCGINWAKKPKSIEIDPLCPDCIRELENLDASHTPGGIAPDGLR